MPTEEIKRRNKLDENITQNYFIVNVNLYQTIFYHKFSAWRNKSGKKFIGKQSLTFFALFQFNSRECLMRADWKRRLLFFFFFYYDEQEKENENEYFFNKQFQYEKRKMIQSFVSI